MSKKGHQKCLDMKWKILRNLWSMTKKGRRNFKGMIDSF